MESIRVYPATTRPYAPIATPKREMGIVGYGRGDHILSVRGPYQSLTEVETEMDNISGGSPNDLDFDGNSAVQRYIELFMSNGARKIRVVEPNISALQTITMTGNGTKRSFDLDVDKTGGAGALTMSPIPGTLHLEHPVATDLVYGTDWICDWSTGMVYFATAPAAAADNIQASWNEYTAANLGAAFDLLEVAPITMVGGAYLGSDGGGGSYALADEVRQHCDAALALFRPRMGFVQGYYQDSTDIRTYQAGLSSEDIYCLASRTGYFNDNLGFPADTWLEFTDPTAILAGIAAKNQPWMSLHEKKTTGINQASDFNSTEVANLRGSFVNFCFYNGVDGYNSKDGWSSGATFRYFDSRSTWIYINGRVKNALTAGGYIGAAPVARGPMLALEATVINEIAAISVESSDAIADPEELSITHPGYRTVMSQLIEALRKAPSDRTPAEEAYIQARQADRTETMYVWYDYRGSLHYIDMYLGGL
jgi:hypothetical protein